MARESLVRICPLHYSGRRTLTREVALPSVSVLEARVPAATSEIQ
jgi:hypothetical protein